MTEEAPAGSSEGPTWALRHRKALASALFVLAADAVFLPVAHATHVQAPHAGTRTDEGPCK